MKISAIIPAAGTGTRYSAARNKLLEKLGDLPVLLRTLEVISSIKEITEIVVCTSCEQVSELVKDYKVVLGGATRQESVFNGLKALDSPDLVIIHDGARPLIRPDIIRESIKAAVEKGAAIVAVPAKDTIKRVNPNSGEVIETLNRKELWNVQTPQVFNYKILMEAHHRFTGQDFTDDAVLMEKAGQSVFVVQGSYKNIKITTEEDLAVAKAFIGY